jgi:hypothetical protein
VIGLFLEEKVADFLVLVGDGFDEFLERFLGQVLQFGRDVDEFVGRADLVVVGIENGLLIDDVDLALSWSSAPREG